MIRIIYGAKGSGKTKKVINEANKRAKEIEGDIVFICDISKYMYDLTHDVRFLYSNEFDLQSQTGMFCFIKGLLAGNNDIDTIYIDGANRMMNIGIDEMQPFIEMLEKLQDRVDTEFVLTVSSDILPTFMEKYKERA